MHFGCSFLAINIGSPILTPICFASIERDRTQPLSPDTTLTGFPFKSGLTFLSHDTKKQSQSTNAIYFSLSINPVWMIFDFSSIKKTNKYFVRLFYSCFILTIFRKYNLIEF